MAAINDLIRQVEDKSLRERLQQEVARLSKQKKFGLVFEDHIPECTPLYGIPIRKGSLVAVKGEDIRDVYCVSSISGGTAAIINKISGNKSERPIETLVVVAQFGEPIYPSLISVDSVTNAPDSSLWHTLIEADNFHALQLLEYLYPKQVDCIYIDPPYNSRAKDWKYNNDYVDPTDSYRHSKWLSMMKRRLKIAKRILNPQNSVLIITIDEKEYLHLGCLLEDMFPEAHIQMVSSVINPKGSARDGFSRSDEYIFFVMFGECTPARLPLSNEWSSSAIVSAQEKRDDDITEKRVEPGWTSMMRRGTDSTRTDSPNLYYPIYVDPETKTIKKIGTSIPLGQDRAEEIPGLVQVLPLRRNGTQGRWQVGNVELKNRIRQGRLRLGRPTAYGFVINYLPDGEYAKVINGEYEIQSYAADGSMVAFKKEHRADELRMLHMLPLWLSSAILLGGFIFFLYRKDPHEKISLLGSSGEAWKPERKKHRIIYVGLFALTVATVVSRTPYWLAAAGIVLAVILLFDRAVLRKTDYVLLVTFFCFFVFSSQITANKTISHFLTNAVAGHEYFWGIGLSQIISNVPASIVLYPFTDNLAALLYGVDTAGLCSVIGSLASVINYRLYVRSYPGQGGRFMKVFTLISWAFFLIVVIPGYFLSKYWLI